MKHNTFQRKFVSLTPFPHPSSTTFVAVTITISLLFSEIVYFCFFMYVHFVFSFFIYFIVPCCNFLNFYAKPCAFLILE